MNQRIKDIRMEQGMSMQKFGDTIGISPSGVAALESGRNNPSEQTIRAICQEFNVNRRWLETGEGDPYVPAQPKSALAEEVAEIMKGAHPMAQAIMTSLAAMPDEWWNAWSAELHKVLDAKKGR